MGAVRTPTDWRAGWKATRACLWVSSDEDIMEAIVAADAGRFGGRVAAGPSIHNPPTPGLTPENAFYCLLQPLLVPAKL
jgi:hypothetical protein